MNGIELIAAERQSHAAKGWDTAHDDAHDDGELVLAALAYAGHASGEQVFVRDREDSISPDPAITLNDPWPWDRRFDKRRHFAASNAPINPVLLTREQRLELLVIAGSLIAAEIDRIHRSAAQK